MLQTLAEDERNGQVAQQGTHSVGDTVGDACFVNVMQPSLPMASEPYSVVALTMADVHRLRREYVPKVMDDLPQPHAAVWAGVVRQRAVLARAECAVLAASHSNVTSTSSEKAATSSDSKTVAAEDPATVLQALREEIELERGAGACLSRWISRRPRAEHLRAERRAMNVGWDFPN